MLNRITPLSAVETVPLLQAFSRVTAHDLISPLDVLVLITRRWTVMRASADLADGAALPVAGKAFAGQPFHDALACRKLYSHHDRRTRPARLRRGGDAGRDEQTEEGIRFIALVKPGRTFAAGEDIADGAVVFRQEPRLPSPNCGVSLRWGLRKLRWCAKVRVAVFSTGDEL